MGYSTVRMKSDRPRAERDFYSTPIGLMYGAVERVVNDEIWPGLYPSNFRWNILDAGCGDGKWGTVLAGKLNSMFSRPAFTTGIDIEQQPKALEFVDKFVCDDYLGKYSERQNFIIGNPPFNLAEEFVHKSLSLMSSGGYVFFLLRLAFLEGRKRQLSLFEKTPLKRVYVLTRRPSFFSTKNGKDTTDTLAYAMFLWESGYSSEDGDGPTLDWLYWENQ